MSSSSVVMRANQEHRGIITTIPILLVVSWWIGYMISIRLLPVVFGGQRGEYFVIAFVAALPFTILVLTVADPILKRVWPSGFELKLDDRQLVFTQPSKDDQAFELTDPHAVLRWQFKMADFPRVGRERQIRRNHLCCACQVKQGDSRLTAFAFMTPRQVSELTSVSAFTTLDMSEVFDNSLGKRMQQARMPGSVTFDIPPQLITQENGRYWIAERQRWEEGVELEPNDFRELIQHLAHHKAVQAN